MQSPGTRPGGPRDLTNRSSAIKRKFGDSVRSRTGTAQRNEVLARFVCHNVCCLLAAWYERYLPHVPRIERTLTLFDGRYQGGPSDRPV